LFSRLFSQEPSTSGYGVSCPKAAKNDWLVKKKEKGETFLRFIRDTNKNYVTNT